jgi:hypothetical protein
MDEQSPSPQVPEAEGGALPAPDIRRPWISGDWAKWLIAAAMLLVVAGGYWAFSQNHRARLNQARALAETKRQMAEGEANPTAEPRAAEDARRDTQAERAGTEAARKRSEAAAQAVAVPTEPSRPLANAPSAAAGAAPDGLYAGPVCYGPAAADPPRCFRAQATISRGRIAGQWPGRDPGVTMFILGEVSASGEAKIRMHAEKPDGTRTVAVDLAGTLKDGRLDATGAFRNGRTATLNWRKSATGSR